VSATLPLSDRFQIARHSATEVRFGPGRHESHRQSEYAAMDFLQFPLEAFVLPAIHPGARIAVNQETNVQIMPGIVPTFLR
jgi:hypothetical protein